jgi:hypothetical protein
LIIGHVAFRVYDIPGEEEESFGFVPESTYGKAAPLLLRAKSKRG